MARKTWQAPTFSGMAIRDPLSRPDSSIGPILSGPPVQGPVFGPPVEDIHFGPPVQGPVFGPPVDGPILSGPPVQGPVFEPPFQGPPMDGLQFGSRAIGPQLPGPVFGGELQGPVLPSDSRFKEDIRPSGRTASGLQLHTFRYRGEPDRYEGVLAQEVLAVRPDAVTVGADGYYRVDYERLGVEFRKVQ